MDNKPEPKFPCGAIVTWLDRDWVGEVIGSDWTFWDDEWTYIIEFPGQMYAGIPESEIVLGYKISIDPVEPRAE